MAEIPERKRLIDGFATLQNGVHEGKSPSLLASAEAFSAGTAARLINTTVRGGFATCRPPFVKFPLNFQTTEDRDWFREHNVQGRETYRSPFGTFIVVSIGGRIYRIDPSNRRTTNVLDLTIDGDPNPTVRPHVWMVQAEQYLIIQDGQSAPLIYDGSELRRSSLGEPSYEVPVGTAMAYGMGRLVVVLPHRRAYVIGDIVHGGTEVIQFTEETYLNEGGNVTVPIPGDITAVKILSQLDRGVGQGDLIIFTRQGAASAKIGEQRETWKSIPFQTVVLLGAGATSQNSVTIVNGDMFFRAPDGLRTLAMTRRDFQTSWSNTPISREVNVTLGYDTGALLSFCESVIFDNRLLLLCNQTPVVNGCFHRGIVALDFDLISGMGEKLPPAYDGLWQGLNVTALVAADFSGTERCFAFHRNDDDENELWEVMKAGYLDNGTNRIEWTIEGASILKLGSSPQSLKKLDGGDVSLSQMQGEVDWTVQYKPDQAPCWFDWCESGACAKVEDCATCPPQAYQPQYRTKKRFPQPPDGQCSASDNKPSRLGYEFQPRITITGKATLRTLRLTATEVEEPLGVMDGCAAE